MKMTKIIIFIDWYFPGFRSGGPLKSTEGIIENLHEDFLFFIVTRNTDYCDNTPYSIEPNSWIQTKKMYKYFTFRKNF